MSATTDGDRGVHVSVRVAESPAIMVAGDSAHFRADADKQPRLYRCRACRRGRITVFEDGQAGAGRRVRCPACRGTGLAEEPGLR